MNFILIQGGGDLATGVAVRLRRAGFHILITELPQPLAVRRAVSFSEAIYEGAHTVEGITARRVAMPAEIEITCQRGEIPVLVDPELAVSSDQLSVGSEQLSVISEQSSEANNRPTEQPEHRSTGTPEHRPTEQPEHRPTEQPEHRPTGTPNNRLTALIDARLLKTKQPAIDLQNSPFKIGLGPGFTAGVNCHAAIETNRGHLLGRVLWRGATSADTGLPEGDPRRVLRAPVEGVFAGYAQIGESVTAGQLLARVGGEPVFSPFPGVLRGLVRPGLRVARGVKIGDVDARGVRDYCFLVSDKALAIGGAALEALLTYDIRP